MRKKFMPKDIEDLADMYYNQNRTKDKEKYESDLQNKLSKWQEDEVREIFEKIGECEKIPRTSVKTFDFKIIKSKLVFDVTTINPPAGESLINSDPQWLEEKIKNAIGHIEQKDSTGFSNYAKGGVIFCSLELFSLTDIWNLLDKTIPRLIKNLDFLIFLPPAVKIGGKSSRDLYPPKIFVKNQQLLDFLKRKLPANYMTIKV